MGIPGKAVDRLISAGMAPDTEEVRAKMRSKFPAAPSHQAGAELPAAAPANEIDEDTVTEAIKKFARGAGAGPSGLRPDILRQLVDRAATNDAAPTLAAFANLLASGRAPQHLAAFVGGAVGYAYRKEGEIRRSKHRNRQRGRSAGLLRRSLAESRRAGFAGIRTSKLA